MSGLINSVGAKSGIIGQTDIVTPHFEAYAADSVAQSATVSTTHHTALPNEKFDSHGWYDNSTDEWKFTPKEAGIYLIGGRVGGYGETGVDSMVKLKIEIMKNASTIEVTEYFDGRSNDWYNMTVNAQALVTFNGTTDYVWLRHSPWAQSGNFVLIASSKETNFWGFKVHNL